MGKLMNIFPVSDLRQNAAKVLKQLRDKKEPIIITQRGRAAAVMIGVEAYEKSEHDKEILHLLAKGDREIEQITIRSSVGEIVARWASSPGCSRIKSLKAVVSKRKFIGYGPSNTLSWCTGSLPCSIARSSSSTLFLNPICHFEAVHFFKVPCIIRDQN